MSVKFERREAFLIGAILVATIIALFAYAHQAFSLYFEAQARPQTVLAIGDSNTYGAGVEYDNRNKNAYPAQLQALLGNRYTVLNMGISGATLLDEGVLPYEQQDLFPISKATQPDAVLIMLGTNDVRADAWNKKEYEAQLEAFVQSYAKLESKPDVYLLSPPAENGKAEHHGRLKTEVIPAIKKVASQTNSVYVNVYGATDNLPELFPDNIHLTAKGYGIIAKTVQKAIIDNESQN